jgi:hypothetical protein
VDFVAGAVFAAGVGFAAIGSGWAGTALRMGSATFSGLGSGISSWGACDLRANSPMRREGFGRSITTVGFSLSNGTPIGTLALLCRY